MERVLVIGPSGAGKSTLATELGRRLALPVHHMDQLHWQPGWVEGSDAELRAKLDAIVASERWLIDGHYGATLAERLARADTVVYLDYPIRLCLRRLLGRLWTYRGRTRPDMTEGCPERFDLEFLLYVLTWNRGPRPRTEAKLKNFDGRIIRITDPKALSDWLAALPSHDGAPETLIVKSL